MKSEGVIVMRMELPKVQQEKKNSLMSIMLEEVMSKAKNQTSYLQSLLGDSYER